MKTNKIEIPKLADPYSKDLNSDVQKELYVGEMPTAAEALKPEDTLVIHPEDNTTDFLKPIYEDQGWTIAKIKQKGSRIYDSQRSVLEYDMHNAKRVVMLGHGSDTGLLSTGGYMVGDNHVNYLQGKENIYIWCNANKYVEKYDLRGFYTGMIISETVEAMFCNVDATEEQVAVSNFLFANAIRAALKTNSQLSLNDFNIVDRVKAMYNIQRDCNPVIDYNIENLFYKPLKHYF